MYLMKTDKWTDIYLMKTDKQRDIQQTKFIKQTIDSHTVTDSQQTYVLRLGQNSGLDQPSSHDLCRIKPRRASRNRALRDTGTNSTTTHEGQELPSRHRRVKHNTPLFKGSKTRRFNRLSLKPEVTMKHHSHVYR